MLYCYPESDIASESFKFFVYMNKDFGRYWLDKQYEYPPLKTNIILQSTKIVVWKKIVTINKDIRTYPPAAKSSRHK